MPSKEESLAVSVGGHYLQNASNVREITFLQSITAKSENMIQRGSSSGPNLNTI